MNSNTTITHPVSYQQIPPRDPLGRKGVPEMDVKGGVTEMDVKEGERCSKSGCQEGGGEGGVPERIRSNGGGVSNTPPHFLL